MNLNLRSSRDFWFPGSWLVEKILNFFVENLFRSIEIFFIFWIWIKPFLKNYENWKPLSIAGNGSKISGLGTFFRFQVWIERCNLGGWWDPNRPITAPKYSNNMIFQVQISNSSVHVFPSKIWIILGLRSRNRSAVTLPENVFSRKNLDHNLEIKNWLNTILPDS